MSVNAPAAPPVDGRHRRPRLQSRAAPRDICMRSAIAWSANYRCRQAGAPISSRSAATAKSSLSRSNRRSPIFAPIKNGRTTACIATGCFSPPSSMCLARFSRPTPADRRRRVRRLDRRRSAGASARARRAQGDHAALCPRGGAAAAGAGRSAGTLWRRILIGSGSGRRLKTNSGRTRWAGRFCRGAVFAAVHALLPALLLALGSGSAPGERRRARPSS